MIKQLEGTPWKHSSFAEDVLDELGSARAKHSDLNSSHEAYAVILEEVQEFWAEVLKKKEERSPERMWHELVQVAAMARRAAEDVVLPHLSGDSLQRSQITTGALGQGPANIPQAPDHPA